MDKLDLQILNILKENGREKASAISQQVNLSVSAVIDRIKKMTTEGIIQGYTVHLDRSKMGLDISITMEVALNHPKYQEEFAAAMHKSPEVISCYQTGGDYDYLLIAHLENTKALEEFQNRIRILEGVERTRTQLIIKEIKGE